MQPPSPARNAESPKPKSLARVTSMPTDAEARSFERTARNRFPVPLRARLPTRIAPIVSTASVSSPYWKRAVLLPPRIERSIPKMRGGGTGFPDGAVELVVVEHELFEREREGERDDRQLHASDPEGGDAGEQPERHGAE